MCDLVLNWIVQQLRKENSTLQELGEYVCKKKENIETEII